MKIDKERKKKEKNKREIFTIFYIIKFYEFVIFLKLD